MIAFSRFRLRSVSLRLRWFALAIAAFSVPVAAEGSDLLSGARQLTFEGRRSGEGYFSADGTKMVFQSEREEGNPFYQIYLMDLETGDTERVSPGTGKTTCAWIHPDGSKVLFASTQDDVAALEKQKEEIAERESGKARKYSWDYDKEFEIYSYDLESGEYTNLTRSEGYDAEGAYSPDGEHIVFASNRQAYAGELSEEDQKYFKLDKKFAMELYLADADGSNPKRLTTADGYDGGPFFSADGKKICWRRFDRKGTTAEIFTMNADGTGEKQLTRLGAMSWAPFFHPSGDYLVFATNLHGFGNFELYLVDAAGEKDPVRVTDSEGFDGLPVFAPDGEQLSWTSNRTPEKQSQIFLADWDDAAARELLGLDPADAEGGAKKATAVPADQSVPDIDTEAAITAADLRAQVEYLASDELAGRLTGTEGERLATAYVASRFEELGLEPGGDAVVGESAASGAGETSGGEASEEAAEGRSYFQEFPFTAGVDVGENNAFDLSLDGEKIPLAVDEGWRPVSFSKNGPAREAGIVFAGYGIESPETEDSEEYSSYFHLDVKGKWVMVLRYHPEDAPEKQAQQLRRLSRLRHKATVARRKFAAGIIFVTGPETEVKEELVPMQFDASLADSGIPAVSMSTEAAARLVAAAGEDLSAIQKKLDTGEMVAGFDLPGAKLSAEIDVDQEKRSGRNVIGVLSAGEQGPHPAPAVLVGAHIDHLGPSAGPGSMAKEGEEDQIHRGADDNASGVAGLLEIAEHLADLRKRGQLDLKRDIVFAAWSGEELGLLGSSHFVRKLAKEALGDENAPLDLLLSSCLNMDMIGRLDGKLILQGLGSSDYWAGAVERRNAPVGLPITVQRDTYLPTDATNFYLRKVPILNAFTGSHSDYHTPRDTADKLNYEGTAEVARFMGLMVRGLALDESAPKYVRVDPPKNRGARGFRVYLGTIPDYSQGDIEGVKLSGVAGKGPAAEAGVEGGDVVVGLAGKEILNIYDYTEAMSSLKVGEETTISVERDGETLEMKIVPGSRE